MATEQALNGGAVADLVLDLGGAIGSRHDLKTGVGGIHLSPLDVPEQALLVQSRNHADLDGILSELLDEGCPQGIGLTSEQGGLILLAGQRVQDDHPLPLFRAVARLDPSVQLGGFKEGPSRSGYLRGCILGPQNADGHQEQGGQGTGEGGVHG